MDMIYDFTGIEQFFEIMDLLEYDHIVSEAKWEALFNTPGYKILTESEFKKSFFIYYFELSYKPSRKKALNTFLKSDHPHKRFVLHYLKVKEYQELINIEIAELKKNESVDEIKGLAYQYLPKKEFKKQPSISFVIFDHDARGYTPIVVDVLLAVLLKENTKYLLAHELHHFYRNQILVFNENKIDSEERDLVYIMNQIQAEGIADLIDKEILYFRNETINALSTIAVKYKGHYDNSLDVIKAMDEKLKEIFIQKNNRSILAKELRNIPKMSGHPLGYYLTKCIIHQEGIPPLVETVDNPFAFFKLYNRCARKENSFSDEAMNVIFELEAKYLK